MAVKGLLIASRAELSSRLGVLESNVAKLHLYGQKAEGDLARPFKVQGGFMDSLTGNQSGPQTDAASIKAAEKAGGKSE